MIKAISIILVLLLVTPVFSSGDSSFQFLPVSDSRGEVVQKADARPLVPPKKNVLDFIDSSLLMLFTIFREKCSDVDDHTCPMHPTCSNFGIEAVRKYGFLLGSAKALDRLHRCGHDLRYYPTTDDDGRIAYEDIP